MRRNLVPRYAVLTLGYAVFVLLAGMLALQLRYDGSVPAEAWEVWLGLVPAFIAFSLFGFLIAGLFHGLWRYAGTATMVQVFKGATLSAIALTALLIATPTAPFSLGFVALVWACELALVGGARVGWRLWRESGHGPPLDAGPAQGQAPSFAVRALVVGAGPAGVHLVQQMRRGRAGRRPMSAAGFLDEDPRLTGKQIEGVRVLGTRTALPNLLASRAADLVVLSDPALPAATVREIVAACERAGVRVRAQIGRAHV